MSAGARIGCRSTGTSGTAAITSSQVTGNTVDLIWRGAVSEVSFRMDTRETTAPPAITVVTTGGTIDKLYFDSLSEYQVGESVVRKLLTIGNVKYPFEIVEALRKDSLELTDQDRDELSGW